MTIKQMEYILELSRTRNFNKAAVNLFITQPALTYQIRRAEEEIGFALFVRTGRGASLTMAGEQFVDAVSNILEVYSDAVERGRRISPEFNDVIRVGVPERVAVPEFDRCRRTFAAEHTNTPVILQYYQAERQNAIDETIEESDLIIVHRERGSRYRRGWKEFVSLDGYLGAALMSDTQDIVVRDDDNTIWVPYSSEPVRLSFQQRTDEKRQVIHDFISFFVQNTQKI